MNAPAGVDVLTGEIVPILTPDEEAECERLETIVARGLRSFRVAGSALAEIRDGRLYRDRYSSFDAYCLEVYGLSRRHVDRLVTAAEVAEILDDEEAGPIGLTSEAQARELAPLKDDPDAMRDAYQEALETAAGEPTAEAIRKVVKRITASTTADVPPPPAPKKRDERGQKIANDIDRFAQNIEQYRPQQADERTVKRLEAWCAKWREIHR